MSVRQSGSACRYWLWAMTTMALYAPLCKGIGIVMLVHGVCLGRIAAYLSCQEQMKNVPAEVSSFLAKQIHSFLYSHQAMDCKEGCGQSHGRHLGWEYRLQRMRFTYEKRCVYIVNTAKKPKR